MVGFSINNFRADLNTRGVMKTNHGQVVFTAPPGLLKQYQDTRPIGIRCEGFNLPPLWFTTDDTHSRLGVGPIDNIPDIPMFDPVRLTFIADRRGFTHKFFYDWMLMMNNFSSDKNGQFGIYESAYRNDYVTDMYLMVFDEVQKQVLEYHLINASPTNVAEQQMNWGEQDQIVKVSVTLTYREYRMKTLDSTFYNQIAGIISAADNILGTSSRIPLTVIDSLRQIL